MEPAVASIILSLVSAALWDGGKRLGASIRSWLEHPTALNRIVAVVRHRTGVELPIGVLQAWLNHPELLERLGADPTTAITLLESEADKAGLTFERPEEVFATLLVAVASSDSEVAQRLHAARITTILEELRSGLGFVFEELLGEILQVRIALDPVLTRSRQLAAMLRESESRAAQCWTALGVEPTLAEGLASDANVGTAIVPLPGKVLSIQAIAGSGKTLTALRTHQVDLVDAVLDSNAPIPVLLHARAVGRAQLRDVVLAQCANLGDPLTVGLRLVIDGVDEVSTNEAQRLLFEAQALAMSWPTTSVVAFSRPDVAFNAIESRSLELPNLATLEGIAATISGRPHPFFNMPAPLREAVKLPLYAIATAVLMQRGRDVPQSRAALIGQLVDTCLKDADIPDEVGLQRLAQMLIEHGPVAEADFGLADATSVARSRLVIREKGSLRFAVPIFEDYFASQILLRDISPVQQLSDLDPWAFDRWRHAIALALARGTPAAVDALVSELTKRVPAGLRMILDEATSGPSLSYRGVEPVDGAARLRGALSVAYEPFCKTISSSRGIVSDPARVSVALHGTWADVQFLNALHQPVRHVGTHLNVGEPAWPWHLATSEVGDELASRTGRATGVHL